MSETLSTTGRPTRPRSRGWRIFFTIFKWCRVAVLLLLLCLLLALIFLHQAGLPVQLQDQLVRRLREAGWDVQFTHLRLRWYQGIVAERLALSPTNGPSGLALFVERAQFVLDWDALRSRRLQAEGLRLTGGRLIFPPPAAPPGTAARDPGLVIERIHGEVHFHAGDRWELRSLEGHCWGVNLRVRGDLTNALRVQDWRLARPPRARPPGAEGRSWSRFLAQARQIRAATPPELQLQFSGDGADPRSLEATLKLITPAFTSPWGSATNLNILAWLRTAPVTNLPQRAGLTLTASHPHTSWGAARQLLVTADWEAAFEQLLPRDGTCSVELQEPETPWGRADQIRLDARAAGADGGATDWRLAGRVSEPETPWARARTLRLSLLSSVPRAPSQPFSVRLATECEESRTPWATSAWARAEGTLGLPAQENLRVFQPALPWLDRWRGVEAAVSCLFSNTLAAGLDPQRLALTNSWTAEGLQASLACDIPVARLTAEGRLDPATRAARVSAAVQGDPQRFAHLLPEETRAWLAKYQTETPLELAAAASATLPPWESDATHWGSNVLKTLGLAGRLQSGPGRLLQVPFTHASAIGLYTNGQLTLPEIRVQTSGGSVEADVSADLGKSEFIAHVKSSLNPLTLRPAFSPKVQRLGFDLFTFTAPPLMRAEARGSWQDWSRLSLTGDVLFTNFTVRSQFIASVQSRLLYTNQFISLLQPSLRRPGGEGGSAEGISFDTATERLYLTNAQGTLDAVVLARIIGPLVTKVLQPYVFDAPPLIRAHGLLPLRHGDDGEDAWFDVEGGPFHWQRFHFDRVRARIHWLGEAKTVTLTNLAGRWCEADAAGWLQLDFSRPRGGTLALHMGVEGANLNSVVRDLRGGVSNRLEGTFRGELNITEAFLDDPLSWQGNGRVELREGLIWDIPIFAVVSPMLNRVIPGLGQSRAREGRATCLISNSVIRSEDLEIRASAMQLKYRGSVDFQGNLDAIMEAELFRNVPGLGMVLSKVLWPVTKLFEYRVGGTLDTPRLDERYVIPKLLLLPLQPVKTLKDLMGQERPGEAPPPPPPAVPAPTP